MCVLQINNRHFLAHLSGAFKFVGGFFKIAQSLHIICSHFTRSFGFGLIAIRENEEAAAVMGVDTTRYKVMAFAMSGFFTSLAGGIHAYWITFIDPVSAFDIGLNVKMIIMAVFGGPGSVLGPVIGAFLLSAISEVLSTEVSTVAGLFFGAVIVVAVVFMPRGLADLGRRFRKVGWRYFAEEIATGREDYYARSAERAGMFLGRGAEYVEHALKILSAGGIRIALDDFGTGYASLSHLKQFPVDIVKIDRSFLRNVLQDTHNSAIIKTVVSLGRSLDLDVVAEGVETTEQEAYLIEQGCRYGQGYLYGKAAPASGIPNLVRSWAGKTATLPEFPRRHLAALRR